ncbi:MAG: ankyrin repeat domain-containing protein [Planctomycetota bacterium]
MTNHGIRSTLTTCLTLALATLTPLAASGAAPGEIEPRHEWIRAIGSDDPAEVRALLDAGADPNLRVTDDGLTPLMISESAALVRLLLERGADPRQSDDTGATALHHALFVPEALEIIPLLLDHGADVNAVAKGRSSRTPLLAGRILMIESDDPGNGARILRMLAAAGADVNARDDLGYTLLMSAAVNDKPDLARLALELGADPRIKSKDGWTAMEYAVDVGSIDVANLLTSWTGSEEPNPQER